MKWADAITPNNPDIFARPAHASPDWKEAGFL
jgi:hypothetical protein